MIICEQLQEIVIYRNVFDIQMLFLCYVNISACIYKKICKTYVTNLDD